MSSTLASRMEIDPNAAPERTTCWADAIDGTPGDRRCWADESDCLSPIFAPISLIGNSGKSNGAKKFDFNHFLNENDDNPQYPLDELHPPYNAFVGGLSFHVEEQGLANFFSSRNCKVSWVRLPREDPRKGKGARNKGFGYVEFKDARSLQLALAQSGSMFQDRKIKVDIADRDERTAPMKKGSSRRKGERERDPWVKEPPRSQKTSGKGPSQLKNVRGGAQGGNDWYADQTWTTQINERAGTRGGESTTRTRYEPIVGSSNNKHNYGSSVIPGARPTSYGSSAADSRNLGHAYNANPTGGMGRIGGLSNPSHIGTGVGVGASGVAGGARGFAKPAPEPTRREAPAERVPLKLLARKELSHDETTSHASAPSEPPRKKVDPFGGAKPRDELEYERRRAAEEQLKQQTSDKSSKTPQWAAPTLPHSENWEKALVGTAATIPETSPPPPPPPPPPPQEKEPMALVNHTATNISSSDAGPPAGSSSHQQLPPQTGVLIERNPSSSSPKQSPENATESLNQSPEKKKDKKKKEGIVNKPLNSPARGQTTTTAGGKEKKKQDNASETYSSGWAANDWDWDGGGWNETTSRATNRSSKGGASNRTGKGKKGGRSSGGGAVEAKKQQLQASKPQQTPSGKEKKKQDGGEWTESRTSNRSQATINTREGKGGRRGKRADESASDAAPLQQTQSKPEQQQQQQILPEKERKKQEKPQQTSTPQQKRGSQQSLSTKDKKKQDNASESYSAGWAENDWDWDGSGTWAETRKTSMPKVGAAPRSGRGKKGKGRGKRSTSTGVGADIDVDWRNR